MEIKEVKNKKFCLKQFIRERNTEGTTAARLWELFKFCVAGGIGFIIDWGGLALLKEYVGVPVLIANVLSFAVSVVVNYLLCAYWVFHSKQTKSAGTMGLFLLTSLIGLALSELFMWLGYDVLNIHYLIVKIISVVLVMIWNYFSKRKVLAGKKKTPSGEGEEDSPA